MTNLKIINTEHLKYSPWYFKNIKNSAVYIYIYYN